jgi:hypothetical protein
MGVDREARWSWRHGSGGEVVAARLEARRSEGTMRGGVVRAAMSRWRGGMLAATCRRRGWRRFQVGIGGGDGGARGEARGARDGEGAVRRG